ncbi:carbon-phosphorus lyase complex subunit PhnI [Robbsia andropogonis]|uniref:Carbon-phosphorus lyase complex subunit PhnI n=1 Tax=Robbsia andropogonis TaxID=28092 RepID=A0A0F5JY79_9BURK|nr:carbon-phosphorus lyase complex subunit PhnI [Robbsia andropogonis]KKB62841.1 carbon-phosphorus lyase complex subunit PhnI [Robbsia andropogonis]MCP1118100.1 carbon-phosphorus lyase complex subunit PhnI [Robbsia andropogonis]MCP1127619.1 carbon-phosphorus lyase complex subunit PhnI [Robbsia andropogonis]
MYVAVKGGEKAILASYRLLDAYRRGDTTLPALSVAQIVEQMPFAVSRVMTEGALYDRHLAGLAIKQSAGDLVEAAFLLRAYRTTLPRFGYATPLETDRMQVRRRISATYKDVPGGQLLGPTFDYTQRLLDFSLEAEDQTSSPDPAYATEPAPTTTPTVPDGDSVSPDNRVGVAPPGVTAILEREGLVEREEVSAAHAEPTDLTRSALSIPADRSARLQNLTRADEGFLLAMGYSTQRGYGNTHPFAAEIRFGNVEVELHLPELDLPVVIGEIEMTECQMINTFAGDATHAPQFTRGYGVSFGYGERKAMSMALVDRSMRATEFGETDTSPANDQEFVLYHSDNVEASGFVQHLKLPHHVDFQADLSVLRQLRAIYEKEKAQAAETESPPLPTETPA